MSLADDYQAAMLLFLGAGGPITRLQVQEALSWDQGKTRQILAYLVQAGRVAELPAVRINGIKVVRYTIQVPSR